MTDQTPELQLRRGYLLAPGEGVIISSDLQLFVDRFTQFMDDTGLDLEDVVLSPLVAFPIPQAARGSDGKMLRWKGVNPAMFWHPLLWLPANIAYRVQLIEEPDGAPRVETNEEWLLRVTMQCVEAGLLDIEMGSWLDVLAFHGLDVNDERVQARIVLWCDGEEDAELDAIDLSPMFELFGPESDCAKNALLDHEKFQRAQWAQSADYLGRVCQDLAEDLAAGRDVNLTQETQRLGFLAAIGWLGGAVTDTGEPVDPQVQSLLHAANADEPAITLQEAIDFLMPLCAGVYQAHSEVLAQLAHEANELEAMVAAENRSAVTPDPGT
ncbi:hypothetical protein [Leucobacter sp. cx-169]|uniref:hypothetical protein n=1 Tax=Leucobacter sp. cx-169 TaxID=2770549 RepID=UPI00165E85E6|nr:hypothetical protein [Leucobacter sp. cx-169]MBC9927344.1 hypothetical protein [Leucobacter sp. cx-169]